jgi:hypothetical protein
MEKMDSLQHVYVHQTCYRTGPMVHKTCYNSGYRWPISTRPASPARSPLFGPDLSPAQPGSMRARADPTQISGSGSNRKLGMVG